jgi:thioredoxin reductase (NADPH)
MVYDVVVVGGGPAGYTAAMYAARAGLSVLVLEKLSAGGQMALTDKIENYPGLPTGIDGFTLGEAMQQSAEQAGAESLLAEVYRADLETVPKVLHTSEGEILGKAVILATGAKARLLGLPLEQELTGRGVHYCAHCDGYLYRGRTVAVVGGGNSAVADALQLSRMAKKVYLIHRRDKLRAEKAVSAPLFRAENVEIVYNAQVESLLREGRLTGLRLQDGRELSVDGLFVSIGRDPVTALFPQLAKDKDGYIVAGESTETSVPGVFAAGDLRTKPMRQIVTAAADGAVAAQAAEHYLQSIEN